MNWITSNASFDYLSLSDVLDDDFTGLKKLKKYGFISFLEHYYAKHIELPRAYRLYVVLCHLPGCQSHFAPLQHLLQVGARRSSELGPDDQHSLQPCVWRRFRQLRAKLQLAPEIGCVHAGLKRNNLAQDSALGLP